jgi:hypothetical protein
MRACHRQARVSLIATFLSTKISALRAMINMQCTLEFAHQNRTLRGGTGSLEHPVDGSGTTCGSCTAAAAAATGASSPMSSSSSSRSPRCLVTAATAIYRTDCFLVRLRSADPPFFWATTLSRGSALWLLPLRLARALGGGGLAACAGRGRIHAHACSHQVRFLIRVLVMSTL